MRRDAYVSFQGNRYSVPWKVAGQEVLLHEDGTHLRLERGGECLAVHPLCASGARQTVTIAVHHAGIPLKLTGLSGKAKILLPSEGSSEGASRLPAVEVRPLSAYEQCGQSHELPAEWAETADGEVPHDPE